MNCCVSDWCCVIRFCSRVDIWVSFLVTNTCTTDVYTLNLYYWCIHIELVLLMYKHIELVLLMYTHWTCTTDVYIYTHWTCTTDVYNYIHWTYIVIRHFCTHTPNYTNCVHLFMVDVKDLLFTYTKLSCVLLRYAIIFFVSLCCVGNFLPAVEITLHINRPSPFVEV